MKNIINGIKNNELLHYIVFFVAFSSINLFPMRMTEQGKASAKKLLAKRLLGSSQREEAIRKIRNLLIFLDDSEKEEEIGFTGSYLITAIGQKVSPIIVSTYLLNQIINEETRYYFIRVFFQSNDWIIKKINDSLNLLIPIDYLKTLNIDADKVKVFDGTMEINQVSDVELQLGLKVNHMENIEYQPMNRFTYHITQVPQFFGYSYTSPQQQKLEFADYFINSLDNIFCKRLDYQNEEINIPEWIIYLAGHGGLLHSIAHISFDGFKKLLHFLDNKISTKLLMISSCYIAGINVNTVYGEIKLGTQEYYSYPIMIQALNDMTVKVVVPKIDIKGFFYKELNLTIYVDFVSFFKKAKELEGNYGEIIKPVASTFIQNIPQIKLPGMEWFSVIDIANRIVSIGSTLVKARDSQKPLNVVSFFKKDPEIILLYTDDIPFELVINSSKMKDIISMVSPQIIEEDIIKKTITAVYTRIKKISSTQNFFEILCWFKSVIFSSYSLKNFFIDEIGDKKDIVIFRWNDGCMRVYYKDKDDVSFTKKLEREELETLKEIQFEKIDEVSEYAENYQWWLDGYSNLAEKREEERKGLAEETEKIKDVVQKQVEEQKKLKEAYTVSEPEVD
jgi:hypothetical protein